MQNVLGKDIEEQPTLLEEYHLGNKLKGSPPTYLHSHGFTENSHFPEEKEVILQSFFFLGGTFVCDFDHA